MSELYSRTVWYFKIANLRASLLRRIFGGAEATLGKMSPAPFGAQDYSTEFELQPTAYIALSMVELLGRAAKNTGKTNPQLRQQEGLTTLEFDVPKVLATKDKRSFETGS